MAEQFDDLEAVRKVVEALQGFEPEDQERVIRWAREKLGLSAPRGDPPPGLTAPSFQQQSQREMDIKTFVNSKNPKAGTHFVATVAYYLRFEAPDAERKEYIRAADLQDASRQVGRERLKDPGKTLRNAHTTGLLDKGPERGTYVINTVGENLVAMTLPASSD
jgi:hypothetical protein